MFETAHAAEWILSLVTTQERASATVGDCLEHTRGTVSFWWFILRTTISMCAREAWASRGGLLRLSIWGTLIEFAIVAGLLICSELAVLLWSAVLHALRGTGGGYDILQPGQSALQGIDWVLMQAWQVLNVVGPFFMGLLIARRSRGRELAAGVAFLIVSRTFGFLIGVTILVLLHSKSLAFPVFSYGDLFLLAGALTWRARHPRPA